MKVIIRITTLCLLFLTFCYQVNAESSALSLLRAKYSKDNNISSNENNPLADFKPASKSLRDELFEKKRIVVEAREGRTPIRANLSQSEMEELAMTNAKVSLAREICGSELEYASTSEGRTIVKVNGISNSFSDATDINEFVTERVKIFFASIKKIEGSETRNGGDFVIKVRAEIRLGDNANKVFIKSLRASPLLNVAKEKVLHSFKRGLDNVPLVSVTGDESQANYLLFLNARIFTNQKAVLLGLGKTKTDYNVQLDVEVLDNRTGARDFFTSKGKSKRKNKGLVHGLTVGLLDGSSAAVSYESTEAQAKAELAKLGYSEEDVEACIEAFQKAAEDFYKQFGEKI